MKCDSVIEPIILMMNAMGFHTIYSCAGFNYLNHVGERTDNQPYILFKCKENKLRKLLGILETKGTILLENKNFEVKWICNTDFQDNILRHCLKPNCEGKFSIPANVAVALWNELYEALQNLRHIECGGKNVENTL